MTDAQLTRAQAHYDAMEPPDPEEDDEREARKRAREERDIDNFVFGENE